MMESEAAPFIGMLMVECVQVGLMIMSKQALSTGMTTFVFVSYSNAFASLVLLPFSLFLNRSGLPPLNFSLLGWFFLLALAGCLAQIFGYAGISYSSPTLGAAMLNLVPGLTFLFAIIFRMEKFVWGNLTCLAKLMGTVVLIAGAFVVTLYQGPPLSTHKVNLLTEQSEWVTGGFLLSLDCVLASSWVIIQAVILKKYPAELTVVFFYCFFVAFQSGLATLIVERDLSTWSLKPRMRLVAVLYSAVFGSAFQVGVMSWCLRKKGPVFVSMFKPLGIAIASVSGVIFFGDTLYLGRLVGVIIIVVGFYSVMWGKAKEEMKSNTSELNSLQSSTQNMPLLGDEGEATYNPAA